MLVLLSLEIALVTCNSLYVIQVDSKATADFLIYTCVPLFLGQAKSCHSRGNALVTKLTIN